MHSFELEDHLRNILKNEIIICQFLRKMGCQTMFFQLFLFFYDYHTAAMSNAQCKTRPTQTFHKLFTMINLNLPYLCVERYHKSTNKD